MADTPAERKRRSRLHQRGDHSMCDASRCRDRGPDPVTAPVADERDQGGIELAVETYVASLGYPDGDRRAILGEIAVRLAKRVDESGALPAAVRELRVLLAQLAEVPNGPAGHVDEVRVRRSLRRLDSLIAQAS